MNIEKNTSDIRFKHVNIRFAILVIFLLSTFMLGKYFKVDLDYYKDFISRFSLIGAGVIFILSYVVVTFLLGLPRTFLRLLAQFCLGRFLAVCSFLSLN